MDVSESTSCSQQDGGKMQAAPSSCLALVRLGVSWECWKWDPGLCAWKPECPTKPDLPSKVSLLYHMCLSAYQLLLAMYCPLMLEFLPLISLFIMIFLWLRDPVFSMKYLSLWSNISRWRLAWFGGCVNDEFLWELNEVNFLWELSIPNTLGKRDYCVLLHILELNEAFNVQRMSHFCYRMLRAL